MISVPPLVIEVSPDGAGVKVSGPIEKLVICLDLLEGAKAAIMDHHRKLVMQGNIVAAPAGALDQIRNPATKR